MKPKFTVALIARNESKTLPRLVESLKEFQSRGGEIVLLDTGSTDGTVGIAANLGCRVQEVGEKFVKTLTFEEAQNINATFQDDRDAQIVKEGDRIFDYAAARNHVAEMAQCDMVAMPDCDEIYTKLDIDAIDKAIEDGVNQLEYNFVFAHDAEGGELIKFTHCKFYDRRNLRWVGVIHEVLQEIPEALGTVRKEFFEENVIKLEHWQNPETNRGHYLTGLALDCYLNAENDRNAHYFGRELFYTGHYWSAIKQLKAHVAMNKWPTEASQSMIFIGDSYRALGDRQEAIGWYARAIDLEPRRREPMMRLAEMYYKEKKVDQTIVWTAAALQVQGNAHFYANFEPYYQHLPHEMMYWALWQKEEYRASKDHFDLCFAYQPFSPKYLHDFRFYYELPGLTFLVNSTGNVEGMDRVKKSINDLNYPQEKVQVIELTGEGTVPEKVAENLQNATGDWIIYANDSIEFSRDSIMVAFKIAMDNKKFFMAFNTGSVEPGRENVCEHFMIHKRLIPKIGDRIFDTDFKKTSYNDLLWEQMARMNQAMRCERAVVRHTVEQLPGGTGDEIAEKDRELLAHKLQTLTVGFNGQATKGNFNG